MIEDIRYNSASETELKEQRHLVGTKIFFLKNGMDLLPWERT